MIIVDCIIKKPVSTLCIIVHGSGRSARCIRRDTAIDLDVLNSKATRYVDYFNNTILCKAHNVILRLKKRFYFFRFRRVFLFFKECFF